MKPGFQIALIAAISCSPVFSQEPNPKAPIYRITVVERTMKAINYQYRNGPTLIDFRGTVLLPKAKGEAFVDSRPGRTEIDAKFENLLAPSRYGREYLTYVLWAVTPEGRPRNLGEIVPNGSDKASLRVTTDLQAFGLIVTAEPYSAVRQPSDVVVVENAVRPETVGKIEEINAKYELMPRGVYTWHVSDSLAADVANAPRVSMKQYEALLELYQAQNALAIARNAKADQFASETFNKAQRLYDEAQRLQATKQEPHRVVESAKEAAETAEDARVIAEKQQHDQELAQVTAQISSTEKARLAAEDEARRARSEAASAQAQAAADREARVRAETEAADARQRAAQAESAANTQALQLNAAIANSAVNNVQQQEQQQDAAKTGLRMRLLEDCNRIVATRDTPRGLVITIPNSAFNAGAPREALVGQLARVGSLIALHPGLRVDVEGHSDHDADVFASQRAREVRSRLLVRGVPPETVQARDMGSARPLSSNADENRRVEVVISGEAIGTLPFWDRTYTLGRR